MTNEEAINYFERSYASGDTDDERQHNDALDKAIEALKQQPFINKPCISEEVCHEDKIQVLDKIRAEIAEYGSICVTYAITDKTKTDEGIEELVTYVLSQAKRQVLDIINKYKAESEE